jgi:hypothetical protein
MVYVLAVPKCEADMEKYHTQWAAQFYAAAELTRRGYLVSLTLGNAKGTDLLVESCDRRRFSVQVKGAKTKAGWYVKESPSPAAFFILVYVPEEVENPPQFFVLTGEETMALVKEYDQRAVCNVVERHHVTPEDAKMKVHSGVGWKDANLHKDRWNKLSKERFP